MPNNNLSNFEDDFSEDDFTTETDYSISDFEQSSNSDDTVNAQASSIDSTPKPISFLKKPVTPHLTPMRERKNSLGWNVFFSPEKTKNSTKLAAKPKVKVASQFVFPSVPTESPVSTIAEDVPKTSKRVVSRLSLLNQLSNGDSPVFKYTKRPTKEQIEAKRSRRRLTTGHELSSPSL